MAIKALAAQAKFPSADPVQRFLATSSTYLRLPHASVFVALGQFGSGEFVDPPQYRCSALPTTSRASA